MFESRGNQITLIEVSSHLLDDTERAPLLKPRGRVSFRYKPYDWNLNGTV